MHVCRLWRNCSYQETEANSPFLTHESEVGPPKLGYHRRSIVCLDFSWEAPPWNMASMSRGGHLKCGAAEGQQRSPCSSPSSDYSTPWLGKVEQKSQLQHPKGKPSRTTRGGDNQYMLLLSERALLRWPGGNVDSLQHVSCTACETSISWYISKGLYKKKCKRRLTWSSKLKMLLLGPFTARDYPLPC